MSSYEYETVRWEAIRPGQDEASALLAVCNARGLAGWCYVDRGHDWLMFRRELPPPGTMDADACKASDDRLREMAGFK